MFSLLYVDDEQGLLELGKLFLESTGEFAVTTAPSGDEGLMLLGQHDFDAIVSDFQMPVMDGIELLKRVRKTFGPVPFILFTGRGREEVVIEAINNGVDFYLQKGGDPRAQFAELALKIRQAVNRRRAEAALSDSEKRLADIINFLPDATFAIDTEEKVIAWNRAMETMTGVASADVLGKGDYEYALPFYHERRPLLINLVLDDDPAIEEKYPFVKKEGRTLFSEITIPHFNDGRGAALWFTASPLYNRKGEVAGAIESIREITERKQAEENLVSANLEYTNLLDQIQDVYYRTDTGGKLVKASRSWAALFGYDSVTECIGMSVADDFYYNPSDRKTLLDEISRNGKVTDYEVLLKKKDGTPIRVEVSSHYYRDHAGKITGIEGTFRDITARRAAEEALNESERRFRELAELLPQGIYEADTGGRMTYVNRHALEMYGYTEEEARGGLDVISTIAPEERERAAGAYRRMAVEGTMKTGSAEYQALRKDGSTFPVAIFSSPISRDGRIVGIRGILMDITERKKIEEELLAANEQLTASGEELRAQYDELAFSEQRVRESEQKYRTVFETTGTAMLIIEHDTVISLVNAEFCRLSGYLREEIENRKHWMEFVVEEDRSRMLAQHRLRRSDPDGALSRYEFRFLARSGEIRNIDISIDIIPGTKKSVCSLLDITARKRTEDELRAVNEQLVASEEELRSQYDELAQGEQRARMSEARLRYMLGFYDHAKKSEKELLEYAIEGAGIVTGSTLGYLAFLNEDESELSMYAWSKTAMAECSMREKPIVYPVAKTGLWGDAVRQRRPVITNDYAAPNPSKRGYPEGHPRIIRHMNVPVIEEGHIVIVAGVANKPSDYTENDSTELLLLMQGLWEILKRRRAEMIKKESEEELQRLKISTDRSSDEIFWMDFTGRILYVNDAACRTTGYSRDEFLNMNISGLDPDCTPEVWDASVADLRERKTQFITTRHRRKDGVILDVEIVAVYVNQHDREYSFAYVRDITDRRRNEDALRESSRKYTELFELGSEAVFLIDNETGALLEANTAASEMYGYPRDTLLTMKNSDLSAEREETKKVTSGSPPGIVRVPLRYHRRKDGTVFPVEIIGRFFIWNGRPVHIAAIRDITEQKRAEGTLAESEEKYRTLVESSFDGIAIHQDGILVYVNQTAARLLGAEDPTGYIGKRAIDIVAPEFREQIAGRVQKGIEGRQDLIREQFLRTDGTSIDVDVTTTPCTWKGRPAVYVTFRDITAQVRAEEALRESEEKYRMLVEQSRDGVFIVQDGRLVFYNKALTSLGGYTTEDLDGRPLADLVAPEDLQMVMSRAQDRAGGSVVPDVYEFSLLHKDGTSRIRVRASTGLGIYKGRPASIGIFYDVTEDRRREEALLESEEKYRTLVEVNRDIIYSLTTDGTIRYVSPQTITQLDYHPDEMTGHNLAEFIHPDDIGILELHIREHATTGKPAHQDQFRVRRKDGTYRWFKDKSIYTTDRRGRRIVAGTIRDITEEKTAQDALRGSEMKFRSLVETTSDFIWEVDADGCYTYVSPQVRRILGYEPEDLLGKTPFGIIPDEDRARITEEFNRCVKSRIAITALENRAVKKDGSVVILETSGVVLTSDDGRFVGYRGIDRDITARKATEDALRESEARLSSILNTVQAGIVIVDAASHQIIDANRKALQLIGLERDSVIGAICHRFICPAEEGKCPVTDLDQQVDTSERILLTASGERISVLKTVVPLSIGNKSVLVESFVDISDQKRSEAAIREANRKLNLLNSITRHDIRNQLLVAQGYTQLAVLSNPDAAVTDFLVKITSAIDTIQHQIEFTKTYQELGVHAPAWFRVGDVVMSVRPGPVLLQSTCKAVEIFADPMIDKVFFNLFDNAVKHGTRVTVVTLGCERRKNDLVITFADNGTGIPDGEKRKIFEKGFGKNTGLGLFLVREILAITGITITETGTYGEGAIFEIVVPDGAFRNAG